MPFRLDPEETETRVIHDLIDFDGADVLEVGCGDGRLTWRFADRARSVLALDPNADRIARALAGRRERGSATIAFQLGDITAVDLPAAGFDVAVLSRSI
jgi:ubiquinone/menaquinone biosynthesis C-methylase UbiE